MKINLQNVRVKSLTLILLAIYACVIIASCTAESNGNNEKECTIVEVYDIQHTVSVEDGCYDYPTFREAFANVKTDCSFSKVERVGDFGYDYKWVGLVAGNNGKLYGIPSGKTEVIEINPMTGKYCTFGKTSEGSFKWTGGVNDGNGLIYGFPRSSGNLLVIYTERQRVKEIPLAEYNKDRYYGGVLAYNRLYCMPRKADHVLVVNLNDYSCDKIAMPYPHSYAGCILHPNGKIYCAPQSDKGNSERVMVINPTDNSLSFIGNEYVGNCFGLAIDPVSLNIYGFDIKQGVVKIDVVTNQVSMSNDGILSLGSYGTILGRNGKMYSILGNGEHVYELDPCTDKVTKVASIKEDKNNEAKCAGGAMDEYGNIWCVPAKGKYIYKYCFSDRDNDETIPVSLLTSPFMGNY